MTRFIKLLFAGVAIALLYTALRGIDWRSFFAALKAMNPVWAGLCVAFEFAALAARAERWNILLAHHAGSRFLVAFVGEAVGDVGNTFLPARAGEPMRTILVARRLRASMPFVIGTAATERVSDAVFVSLVAFLMLLFVPQVPAWLTGVAAIFCALGISVLLSISFLPAFNKYVLPHLERIALLRPLTGKVEGVLTGVWQGSQALFGHPRRFAQYVCFTVMFWLIDGIAIFCLARAFDAPVTLPEAMLFLTALGLSSAIPSTPGYIGIYQFVAISVLMPFGVSQVDALAVVLVYQVSGILLQLLSAGVGWLVLGRTTAAESC